MKIAVFDIDDTLIIHGNGSNNYYKDVTSNIKEIIDSKLYERIYIFTNGTWGHGYHVCEGLGILDDVSFIYGRDNLQRMLHPFHMKPNYQSFLFVNYSIQYDSGSQENEIHFFDDMKENLKTAKGVGWKTILINPTGIQEDYIDHVFPNIYAALLSIL
tara:strand:+ start:3189 stop:3662 length:474 start_codon:yes stop_codon:yes gene_type:complete